MLRLTITSPLQRQQTTVVKALSGQLTAQLLCRITRKATGIKLCSHFSIRAYPNVQSVEDLRVADNYVFFCGKKSGEGFIGCIPLVDMVTSTPTVNYTSVGDESVEHFHSMVAYKHGPNVKVVAVGEYHWHDNTSSSSYGNCSVGYHLCARRPIAEFTFSGSTGILMNLWTSDDGVRVECANEVIETPTHVAIICYYTDNRAITIHLLRQSQRIWHVQ